MELRGILISHLDEIRGESARGPWIRGGFVIETLGEYPKKIAIQCFGEEKINAYKAIKKNSLVKVKVSIESKEYPVGTKKWYTSINCIRVEKEQQDYDFTETSNNQSQSAQIQTAAINKDEDLPF